MMSDDSASAGFETRQPGALVTNFDRAMHESGTCVEREIHTGRDKLASQLELVRRRKLGCMAHTPSAYRRR